jgi:hypothetical protein
MTTANELASRTYRSHTEDLLMKLSLANVSIGPASFSAYRARMLTIVALAQWLLCKSARQQPVANLSVQATSGGESDALWPAPLLTPSVASTATSGPVTDNLSITMNVPTTTAMLVSTHPEEAGSSGSRSLATLALLLPCSVAALFGLRLRGIVLHRLLMLALLGLAGATSLTGCGSSSNNTVARTYSIPVSLSVAGGTNQIVSTTIIVK